MANSSGLNKDEAKIRFGEEQVATWRRSFDIPPPGGESLKQTAERVLPYYYKVIWPQMALGKNVIVVGARQLVARVDHEARRSDGRGDRRPRARRRPRPFSISSRRPATLLSAWISCRRKGATMAWDDLGRMTEQENSREAERWIGVYIAVLAVVLALCAMGGGNAAKDATIKNIEATNTWAFFQAKNMRRHVLRLQADELELRLTSESGLSDSGKASIAAKIAEYRAQDRVLTEDPDKPEDKREGLDQLWAKAKALEAARDVAARKDPIFDYAEALLQIAIVLASVAIISRHRTVLLGVSACLGILGALLTINGFTLAVGLPFIG